MPVNKGFGMLQMSGSEMAAGGCDTNHVKRCDFSNDDASNLVQGDLIVAAVIERGGFGAGVAGELLGSRGCRRFSGRR
jgi:hypothetical protein